MIHSGCGGCFVKREPEDRCREEGIDRCREEGIDRTLTILLVYSLSVNMKIVNGDGNVIRIIRILQVGINMLPV